MSTITNNISKYSKYLIDSSFETHSYDDIVREISPELFSVVLLSSGWDEENKTQTIESDIFSNEGYIYTINILSDEDKAVWVGADIAFDSISNGAINFIYSAAKPVKDIVLLIEKEPLIGESIIAYATNEVVVDANNVDIISQSMSFDDMVDFLEG